MGPRGRHDYAEPIVIDRGGLDVRSRVDGLPGDGSDTYFIVAGSATPVVETLLLRSLLG